MSDIKIVGLTQHNLKNISLTIPTNQLVVFTGVSGSGKSSIVFDTIGAESQRQMNETYSAFIRGRLPKQLKPEVEKIEHLNPSVIVDQSPLGGNQRSTVGTISELYSLLRLLYSRIGQPAAGSASHFSFNDPKGMCLTCSGLGKVTTIDVASLIDRDKSLNEGPIADTRFRPGTWSWKTYASSGLFELDKPLKDYSSAEYQALMEGYVDSEKGIEVEGLRPLYHRLFLNRDLSQLSKSMNERSTSLIKEEGCPTCQGRRLNQLALQTTINDYSIAEMCQLELDHLYQVLQDINDPRVSTIIDSLRASLKRMIEIGLPYLSLNRESMTLSGGEAQRLKIVRYMGSSLIGMIYIFDEPTTGMHPRDVYRMNQLLKELRDKGNTVLVVEHDQDVIEVADHVIDVGPLAGKAGGEIVYQGSYQGLLESQTVTAQAMKACFPLKADYRQWQATLPVKQANANNLKNVSTEFPMGVMTVVTGVAGSGKSSLMSVFAETYGDQVIKVDQGPITATNRSMPATYLGFFDRIRKLIALETQQEISLFSYNSKGACPDCQGKGVIVTELVFMDPIVTTCESCCGQRFSKATLDYSYHGKNMVEIMELSVIQALEFFSDPKVVKQLQAMEVVGLGYLSIGQALSTLSGGERQRIKLAKHLDKKGTIYLLDEPTTGLHSSDIHKLLDLFNRLVAKGNTVIIIEHCLDVIKQADWLIDVGPDGGKNGGQIVFEGTPQEMVTASQSITADCLRRSLNNVMND